METATIILQGGREYEVKSATRTKIGMSANNGVIVLFDGPPANSTGILAAFPVDRIEAIIVSSDQAA